MSLIDLDGLENLSKFSVEISKLSPKKEIERDDLFLVAKKMKDGVNSYDTKVASYDMLSSNALDDMTNVKETLNFTGTWNFQKNNAVFVDTLGSLSSTSLTDEEKNKSAVNLDYLYNYLLPKLYSLSGVWYDKNNPHIPSVDGMHVITNNKSFKSSSGLLKKIYSGKWGKVTSGFLWGTGQMERNTTTKFGKWNPKDESEKYPEITKAQSASGTKWNIGNQNREIRLTINNYPTHGHRFSAKAESFEFTFSDFTCSGQFYPPKAVMDGIHNLENHTKPSCVRGGNYPGGYQVKVGPLNVVAEATYYYSANVSTEDFGAQLGQSVVDSSSGEPTETGQEIYHNNMPPFITKYVWHRWDDKYT